MITNDDIVGYLIQTEEHFEEIQEGLWVLEDDDGGGMKIFITHDGVICKFRMKLMDAPAKNREEFYAKLLEYNATGMESGAYALEGNSVVVIEQLQSENMDYNEFEAALETLIDAAIKHYPELSKYRN